MDYVGQRLVDSVLKKLSENATIAKLEIISKEPLKNAAKRFLDSIQDPANSEMIDSHFIQPISIYMHDNLKPYALAIICLFAIIAVLLFVVLGLAIHTRRTVHRLSRSST